MKPFKIDNREIGEGKPAYIIAEISCNHEGNKEEALKIIKAAATAGADAVKIQTYTPDTISRKFDTRAEDTIWSEIDLHALYSKAYTPWEWSIQLKKTANDLGLDFFSSPFDETAVDFLANDLGVPALKIASFEVVDTKLLEKAAKTGLPIIMSNGMTDFLEMNEAVTTLKTHGCKNLALLHCNSGYPAAFDEVNLKTIPVMKDIFGVPVGLSDHTLFADHKTCLTPMAHLTPIESMRFGADIIEVHLTLDRNHAKALFEKGEGGYDWPFSMDPDEFKQMVDGIRHFEKTGNIDYSNKAEEQLAKLTHGEPSFMPTEKELASRKSRPSLWIVKDIKKGEPLRFAAQDKECGNFDSIRPGGGLHIRFADLIENRIAALDLKAGQPLSWDMVTRP